MDKKGRVKKEHYFMADKRDISGVIVIIGCSAAYISDEVLQNGLRQRKPQEEEDIDMILQHHRQMHEKLAEELLHHTHNLKDFAYSSSAIVKKDVEVGFIKNTCITFSML